jgi:predicted peroxiredoxin
MRFRAWLLAMALLIVVQPAGAADEGRGQERKLVVHVTGLLDAESGRTALVFRAISGALSKGCRVVLLFDAEGAATLKLGRWFGGDSTPLDRTEISPKDRDDIAALLGTTADSLPETYGNLLRFLKGRGLRVCVNKRALELRGIGEGQFDQAAEAVGEDKIIELLTDAASYVTY